MARALMLRARRLINPAAPPADRKPRDIPVIIDPAAVTLGGYPVVLTDPEDGDVLTFDADAGPAGTGAWVNAAPST